MKNKFILGLIFGVLLIGLVSAGITGYLTQGQNFSSDGISATLQGVSRDGVATVVVENTNTGATETVQVASGESALTSFGEIQISGVRPGTLFRRPGAQIQVTTPSSLPNLGSQTQSNSTNCTISWLNQTQTNNNFTISIISSAGNVTANNSGVFIWANQKGFKYANDGKVDMKLQETKSNLRKWVCNRGWLDTSWLCKIN